MYKLPLFLSLIFSISIQCFSQVKWKNVDYQFQPLPQSVHIFYTNDAVDGKPNIAYYVEADLKDKSLDFTTDTTYKRRLTPSRFYDKNNKPLVVVNGTFFSFETNQNLNVVIADKKLVSYNSKTYKSPKDTTKRLRIYSSAIGINKRRKADVAWINTDSSKQYAKAVQYPYTNEGNFFSRSRNTAAQENIPASSHDPFRKWKMQTAIGGGPVLIQNGEVKITNNEERMFAGKAINDKHPRTAMGYTQDGKLIILVVQGRMAGIADGASLIHEANMLKQIGCVEALNLDGGGSSCLLINGKETIKPSDPNGQRPVPAVFMIKGEK